MELEEDHLYVGFRQGWGGDAAFALTPAERRQHVHVIGQTGTGKSTLLRNLILQDIDAGRGVGLIDPHGDLASDVLEHIPARRINDVAYFDPSARHPLALNLFRAAGSDWHLVASGIVSAFKKIWGASWGPRLEYVLYASLAALLQCENASLLGVSRMLHDEKYRAWVVKQVKDPMIRSFWLNEFENYERGFRQEVVGPIQNKVGQLFLAPALRNVLGQIGTRLNIRALMDRQKVFVANLSKGKIGETHSSLLGSLLVTGFEIAALSRANCPQEARTPFYLYVDEFQNCATESFAGILSEARKYGLSLTLAHQYLGQLDERIHDAVFGNVGTLLSFRAGETDAARLARQFGGSLASAHFTSLGNYEMCARLIGREPFFAKSLPPLNTPSRRRKIIIRQSRQKYSRRRKKVEEKIERWLKRRH